MNQLRHKQDAATPEKVEFADFPQTITPLEQPLRIGRGIMRNVVFSPMSAQDNIQTREFSTSPHHK